MPYIRVVNMYEIDDINKALKYIISLMNELKHKIRKKTLIELFRSCKTEIEKGELAQMVYLGKKKDYALQRLANSGALEALEKYHIFTSRIKRGRGEFLILTDLGKYIKENWWYDNKIDPKIPPDDEDILKKMIGIGKLMERRANIKCYEIEILLAIENCVISDDPKIIFNCKTYEDEKWDYYRGCELYIEIKEAGLAVIDEDILRNQLNSFAYNYIKDVMTKMYDGYEGIKGHIEKMYKEKRFEIESDCIVFHAEVPPYIPGSINDERR